MDVSTLVRGADNLSLRAFIFAARLAPARGFAGIVGVAALLLLFLLGKVLAATLLCLAAIDSSVRGIFTHLGFLWAGSTALSTALLATVRVLVVGNCHESGPYFKVVSILERDGAADVPQAIAHQIYLPHQPSPLPTATTASDAK
jgi:hypothetical protein